MIVRMRVGLANGGGVRLRQKTIERTSTDRAGQRGKTPVRSVSDVGGRMSRGMRFFRGDAPHQQCQCVKLETWRRPGDRRGGISCPALRSSRRAKEGQLTD